MHFLFLMPMTYLRTLASMMAGGITSALCVLVAAAGDNPAIRLQQTTGAGNRAAIEVVGLAPADLATLKKKERTPAEWQALLAVSVVPAKRTDPASLPAMLGTYEVADNVLRFVPRFPLVRGLRYRAVFQPKQLPGRTGTGIEPIVAELLIPKPPTVAATVVERVYPSTDELPENQLKFYLHFSAPMSRGEAYQHLHLLTADGKEVDLPFLELGQELWDPQGKRFTLYFDPGRVKRGLKPREEVGPILEEGKSYTLVIDRDWLDAEGSSLKQAYRKRFRVGPPDDRMPDPRTWKVRAPRAGTTEPLVVRAPESLEHALFERLLWVVDAEQRKVAGTAVVSDMETCWQLTPAQPWRAGRYQLVADTTLEDLAGNSIARPFEVDVFRPIEREIKTSTVAIPFTIQ